jgi:amino acid adenylation domain-containing protein
MSVSETVVPPLIDDLTAEGKRALLDQILRARRGEARRIYPLSYGQQALYLLYLSAPESAAYHMVFAVRIRTAGDLSTLRAACHAAVKRHPVLHSRFRVQNGQPIQEVVEGQEISFEHTSVERESWETVLSRAVEASRKPFDLGQGPPVRFYVFSRSYDDHLFLLVCHHIAFDALSLWLFLDELRLLYGAELVKSRVPLAAPRLTYADYILWQKHMLCGPLGDRMWNYWREQLAGVLTPLNLPYDHPRPPVQTYRGALHSFTFEPALAHALYETAREYAVTPFMLLLSCFQVLLHRYTGHEDIIVGSPAAGRTRSEFQSLVGYFVNPVVFRTSLAGDPQFSELLVRTRRTVLDGLANQDFPFPLLVQRLHPRRDPSRSPIFQVMFVSQQAPRLIDLPFRPAVEPVDIPQRLGQFDLVLESVQEDSGVGGSDMRPALQRTEPHGLVNLRFNLKYNPDLFDKATIVRMSDHLRSISQAIVSNPSARISDLSLLSAGEIRRRLEESRGTERRSLTPGCVHHWFEAIALVHPNDIAVVSGSEQITYCSLNTRANILAHYLCQRGIGAEMLVAICLPVSIDMIIAVLGVLKAGGAYLPLDPEDPDARLSDLLGHAEPAAIVAMHEFEDRNVRNGPRRIYVDREPAGGENTTWNPTVNIPDDTLAYVIYTSGSTGDPEAVAVEHRQIANYVHAAADRYEWKPGLNFAMVQPPIWDGCLTMLFGSLCTGGTLHLIPRETTLNARALGSYFTSHRIDCAKFTPSHFAALDSTGTPDLIPRSCLILAGESSTWRWADELQTRAPDCRIYNGYGPTEATVAALTYCFDPMKRDRSGYLLPLGYPLANITVRVLDQYMQLCPIGVTGEICIGGAGVARGYLKNPNSTSAKFVADPFSKDKGARIFRSGDLGRYLADGSIEFAGRVDDQIKIRGLRVEPREIELALGKHPHIRQTVIVGSEEPAGRNRLVAYIVADGVGRPSARQLREFLSQRLPAYMCPSSFIFLDALPLRKSGKVDRSVLPDPNAAILRSSPLTPRSETEEVISRVWRECLGISVVLPDDNFFDIGGDSLLLIRVHSRLEEAFGSLSVLELFEYATISSLAEHLRSRSSMRDPLKESYVRGKMREDSKGILEDQSEIRAQHRTARTP